MPDQVTTAAPAKSEADTPAWKDKSLWAAAAAVLLPILNAKFGLGLQLPELVAAIGPLAAFIVGNKWKSGRIKIEEIKARNTVTLPEGMTREQAAALLGELGRAGKALLLVLALLLAISPARAFAQEPAGADAPYAIAEKEPAPAAGVFLTTARAGAIFKECAEARANAAELEKALQDAPGTPFVAIITAASLGLAVGIVVTFLVTPKRT